MAVGMQQIGYMHILLDLACFNAVQAAYHETDIAQTYDTFTQDTFSAAKLLRLLSFGCSTFSTVQTGTCLYVHLQREEEGGHLLFFPGLALMADKIQLK